MSAPDYQMRVNRSRLGTFVKATHKPTGRSMMVLEIGRQSVDQVRAQVYRALRSEVRSEESRRYALA